MAERDDEGCLSIRAISLDSASTVWYAIYSAVIGGRSNIVEYHRMREAGIRRKCGWSLSLIGHGGCSCMRVKEIQPDYIPIRSTLQQVCKYYSTPPNTIYGISR